MRSIFDASSQQHFQVAANYYAQEREAILASARNFTLDWYWAKTAQLVDAPVDSFYMMIWKRSEAMRSRLVEFDRQDFRVEKDKCNMYHWFALQEFPTARVLGIWREKLPFFHLMDQTADENDPTVSSAIADHASGTRPAPTARLWVGGGGGGGARKPLARAFTFLWAHTHSRPRLVACQPSRLSPVRRAHLHRSPPRPG